MNTSIDTKELCKQLKYFGKHGFVIWARQEEYHYISNRHFAVRFKELPRDVLVTLFSIFCKLAEFGETLTSLHGEVIDQQKPINFTKIYQPEKQTIVGIKTPFFRHWDKKITAAIIKFPERVSYVDDKYVKFARHFEKIKSSDSPHAPIYMADDDLMLLPIRTSEGSSFINELVSNAGPA